jgi:hypothetical protein
MKPWEPSMQSKLLADSAGQRTFVMILDPGEEAFGSISDFAAKEGVSAASLTALGGHFHRRRPAGSTSLPRAIAKFLSPSNARC